MALTTLKRIVPALEWMAHYKREDLSSDLTAGITVAVMLIPQAMAYSMLAGLPPIIGLYSSILPLIVYALLGSSRQLAVGPVAMVALLVSSGVGALAPLGSEEFIALTITLALMVGLIQTFMGVARLGFLTNFLSHPVISGFTSAAALIIGFSQLKHLVGFDLPGTHLIHSIVIQAIAGFANINWITMGIGLGGMGILIGFKRISPLIPGALIAVIVASALTYWLNLHELGVSIVGKVPEGLPPLSMPRLSHMSELLPTALAIAFVGFLESIAVAKNFARKHRYEVSSNKELIGLGMANLVGSFFKAMPVTGGFSRSAVNDAAGAKTGLASIITAVIIAISLMFFTPLFYYLPKAILASIIMVAVFGLIDLAEVKHLWKVQREDLFLLGLTFVATLSLGIKQGIAAGAIASLLWFSYKATRPHFAILGRIPATRHFRNQKNYQVEKTPNTLMIRFDAQFYYGNVSFLKETLKESETHVEGGLKYLVIDASSINNLDSSADSALHELLRDYHERGIVMYFAGLKMPVMNVMKSSGFLKKLGQDHIFFDLEEAVSAIQLAEGSKSKS